MSKLLIFADEAGTMPLKDNGGIFVTSAIAFFDEAPKMPVSTLPRNRNHLVKALKGGAAYPSVSMLIPYQGYAQNLKDKFDQWEVMGQATLESTGKNSRYLRDPNSGKPLLSRPNLVWAMYMQDVIHNALVKAVLKGMRPIEEVEIILDQKSLSKGTKAHFCDLLQTVSQRLRDTLQLAVPKSPQLAREILEWVRFTAETTHIRWEGEDDMEWAADGLMLADTLASSVFTDFNGRSGMTIVELMEKNGIRDFMADRSDWAKVPVNKENLKNWEDSTGATITDVRLF